MRYFKAILIIIYTCTSLLSMDDPSEILITEHMAKISENVKQCPCGEAFSNYHEIMQHIKDKHWISNIKYKCPKCQFRPDEAFKLLLHFTNHTKEIIYDCSSCDFSGSHSHDIREHLKLHIKYSDVFAYLARYQCCLKNNDGNCKCPECKSLFRTLGSVLSHIKKEHLSSSSSKPNISSINSTNVSKSAAPSTLSKEIIEAICFSSQNLPPLHSYDPEDLSNKKKLPILEPRVSYDFKQNVPISYGQDNQKGKTSGIRLEKKSLSYNYSAKEAIKMATKCPCGEDFDNFKTLKAHINGAHFNNKLYECPSCPNKRTKKILGLISHFPTHTKEPIFDCDYCNLHCKNKRNLSRHLKLHQNHEETFKLLPKDYLKNMHDQEPTSYKCPMCCSKESYLKLGLLLQHIERNCPQSTKQLYKDTFKEKTISSQNLQEEAETICHENIQDNQSSFLCPKCNLRIKNRAERDSHSILHNNYHLAFEYLQQMSFDGKDNNDLYLCPSPCKFSSKILTIFLQHIDTMHIKLKAKITENAPIITNLNLNKRKQPGTLKKDKFYVIKRHKADSCEHKELSNDNLEQYKKGDLFKCPNCQSKISKSDIKHLSS